MKHLRLLTTAAFVSVVALTTGITACSSGGSTSTQGEDGGTYTIWDPYPQFAKDSAWVKLLDGCGTKAGVKIKRTAFDTSEADVDAFAAAVLAAAPNGSPAGFT